MSNWYDDVSDEEIRMLKENVVAYGLLKREYPRLYSIMSKIPSEDLLYFSLTSLGGWSHTALPHRVKNVTYRLKSKWQRPKPQTAGQWVYYEVTESITLDYWVYETKEGHLHELYEVINRKGFGGIEFEEKQGYWHMEIAVIYDSASGCLCNGKSEGSMSIPATPNRVRFWVEG